MSATPYKRPDVDIFICIEMARERNRIMKKKHPVLPEELFFSIDSAFIIVNDCNDK